LEIGQLGGERGPASTGKWPCRRHCGGMFTGGEAFAPAPHRPMSRLGRQRWASAAGESDTHQAQAAQCRGRQHLVALDGATATAAAATEGHFRTAATVLPVRVSSTIPSQLSRKSAARAVTAATVMCSSPYEHRHSAETSPGLQRVASSATTAATSRDQPIVFFFDVMDTLVCDPFFKDMHLHFGFAKREDFLAAKHPETWIRFERGELSVTDLEHLFFRPLHTLPLHLAKHARFNARRFEAYLRESYRFMDEGIEPLLEWLASRQPPGTLHILSNYPCYYRFIEEKLGLSRYLSWTAVSCETGLRKPDPRAYAEAATRAGASASQFVLIDDQKRNIDGALAAGFGAAILYPGTSSALRSLLEEFLDGNNVDKKVGF